MLGLDNGTALQIHVSDTLSFSFLKRSSLQRSIFGYFTGSSTPSAAASFTSAGVSASSILGSSSERLLCALPGNLSSLNRHESSSSFYIASTKSLQKWALQEEGGSFSFIETFRWEINLVSHVTSHLQLHASIRDVKVVAVAAGSAKLSGGENRIACLVQAHFRSDPACYFLIYVKENESRDGIDFISCKKLKCKVSEVHVG